MKKSCFRFFFLNSGYIFSHIQEVAGDQNFFFFILEYFFFFCTKIRYGLIEHIHAYILAYPDLYTNKK